ncbi:helix-turn-helix domain-containing protein [Stenotrophomonas maltophilia]|uniref:helix-turn-helix domain-containing protein n=1 Tax=Stenotrophomonas maltophilia TaxID=40324 RepID=UPI0013DC4EAC|nr:helix-turn-helix transcriptional regulator [Stenotrophomonas maltophilia]
MPRDERYTTFEQALTSARIRKGLTQREMAARLNKPQSYISKYEGGERRLDVIEALDVCAALGISLKEIIAEISPGHD